MAFSYSFAPAENWDSPPRTADSVGRTPACRGTAGEQPVQEQQEHGPADRDQPGPDVEELIEIADVQCTREEAADERAGDTNQRRHDDAARVVAGQDELRYGAGKQAEQDPTDDAHG